MCVRPDFLWSHVSIKKFFRNVFHIVMHLKTLVRAKGLEPSTSTLARLRSSQLSYARTAWCILTYLFSNCKCYFIDNFYGLDMLILMKNIPDKNLGSARKSRELLMAGSYNTLFDNLVFNPPARFFVYAAPDSVHDIFHRTFDALNNAATSINRHDAWAFDDVARILMGAANDMQMDTAINFLVSRCAVPETHLYIRRANAPGQLFPTNRIYLSRYAMCRVANYWLATKMRADIDMGRPVLTATHAAHDNGRHKIQTEMQLAFAAYYFAFPETDCDEIARITWDWVRAKPVKRAWESAQKNLTNEMRRIYGREFSFHLFEEFKQEHIFNPLFRAPGAPSIRDQYAEMLTTRGFKPDTGGARGGWRRGRQTAPKYPGGYFAPHALFLAAWITNQFCEFISNEPAPDRNRTKWFELRAKNFMATIGQGLAAMRRDNSALRTAQLWAARHHSDALKSINEIKHGRGHRKTDDATGQVMHDNPSAMEFFRTKHLFSDDDMWCLKYRQNAQRRLVQLHDAYRAGPTSELAQKIADTETQIRAENITLYDMDLGGFVDVPHILNADGQFVPRPVVTPVMGTPHQTMTTEPAATPVHTPQPAIAPHQYTIDFDAAPWAPFVIKSPSKIPDGAPFIQSTNPTTGAPYVMYDTHGQFESVNPLRPDFTVRDRMGNPKNNDVNFEMGNFLLESDTMPPAAQLAQAHRLVALGVINKIVWSGSKSYHMRCTVRPAPQTRAQRKWLFAHIINTYNIQGIDPVCWNNGRLMWRAGATRLVDGRAVTQTLIHQSDAVLDMDWRPLYDAHTAIQKHMFETTHEFSPKINDRVRAMLAQWHDGNRHNLLNMGIIPMMHHAGWTDNQIRAALISDGGNPGLNRTIEKYINNIRGR